VRRWLLALMLVVSRRALGEPNDFVARPLVLDEHQVDAELVTEINLAPRLFARPLSLAPDVWFGVLPQLTVGVVHSSPSVDRFQPGATFCVRHVDALSSPCQATYHGSGIDARYLVIEGKLAVAPRMRVLVRQIDPVKPAVTLGALVRWTRGRFAITGDPYLQLSLANIDQGNRHALFLPVTFALQPTRRWELALRTGINSELGTYPDANGEQHLLTDVWHVPIAIATRVAIDAHFDLGAMLAFPSLLGPQPTPRERALFFTFAWRS
jgi:hypothetical protein